MTNQFTAIEIVDRNSGNIVADVYGYLNADGTINDLARVNLKGYMRLSGFGTWWFIPTRWTMPLSIQAIQEELDRMKEWHQNAIVRITEKGKRFIAELHLSI